MSNSKLVCYTKLSPNCTKPRNKPIDRITIHCMAGNCSVETCGEIFAPTSRQASSNYGIGSDGRIALYVDEANRSWCTSSGANDNRAITIEAANNGGAPDWPVSDKALAALIDLCTDICKRNGIKQLVWRPDKNNPGNMTVHRWFANKSCPGDYLYERHGYIAAEVNKRLGTTPPAGPSTKPLYRVRKTWADSITQKGAFSVLENAKKCADQNPSYSVFDTGGKAVYPTQPATFTPYTVKVTADVLNIRKGPGTTHPVMGAIKNGGVYTIVAESTGAGASKWGKLKSGAGWISLDYCRRR